MKIIAGTNRKKKEAETDRGETSEEPKEKKNTLKIPKSVTDEPQKHNLQHTVRQIHNGYIRNTTYNHPDHGYVSHEVYYESDPFGHVKGLE